tara:strand:- start:2267 stop:3118 length:852 start_codon:yes stop_codon:yes gene_type:complete
MTDERLVPFPPEVAKLITLGEPEIADHHAVWPDYRALGIAPDHLEDLLRLAEHGGPDELVDDELNKEDAWWASFHACCALGQLQMVEAAPRVLELLKTLPGDDFLHQEIGYIMSAMGPDTIEYIARGIENAAWDPFARIFAGEALVQVGKDHPAARQECLDVLERELALCEANEPEFNGFLISGLIDLKGKEVIAMIKAAFAADTVDQSIAGDLEDVEIALGLRHVRDTPRPHYGMELSRGMDVGDFGANEKPAVNPFRHTGRNDPCPCGSGKKFKKCCLKNL